MLFGGIVLLWLGIMIWEQFPLSGVVCRHCHGLY